jgi:chromosome segregation ATPase
MSNELYMDYESILSKQKETLKEIVSKIKEYQKIISSGTNTIKMEQDLEREINNAKEMSSKLETAYNYKNAPSSIPPLELDKRQKEIQELRDSIIENEQNYRNYKNQKYSYKDRKKKCFF